MTSGILTIVSYNSIWTYFSYALINNYHLSIIIHIFQTHPGSTFYFQLPEPNDSKPGIKSKKLHIEVRGLQPPDPDEQSNFDHFVQQKLEEAKLEDIAYRLKRNSQVQQQLFSG